MGGVRLEMPSCICAVCVESWRAPGTVYGSWAAVATSSLCHPHFPLPLPPCAVPSAVPQEHLAQTQPPTRKVQHPKPTRPRHYINGFRPPATAPTRSPPVLGCPD